MNLLIHDLDKAGWDRISKEYGGWEIISDQETIRPCMGCFGCWLREPGQCVIKDGYERMGELLHKADQVTVISRYTYGGFSSFVKNVFDRSIGFVLPYFEVYEGEMHHKKRYPEDKPFAFIFRGTAFTDEEKQKAERYVKAVCRNLHGRILDIRFEEDETLNDGVVQGLDTECEPGRILLLNASLRGGNSNTGKFLDRLSAELNGRGELVNLSSYLNRQDELDGILKSAGMVVLGMPLYVDGIPSALLRVMERLEKRGGNAGKRIYALVNMGMYESNQIINALSMVKDWSGKCGYVYHGGMAIGAGEMMGMFMNRESGGKGPAKAVIEGIGTLADAVRTNSKIEDIYADAYRFPRWVYIFAANSGWPAGARKNGLKKKDLLRRYD